jgi:hypothetical protein
MSFVLTRSAGGTHVRSPGGAKNPAAVGASCACLAAYWPISGMGTFNASAEPSFNNGLTPDPVTGLNSAGSGTLGGCMDDIWPNVYRKLTEVFTDPTGTYTIVSQYQDYVDQLVHQTITGTPRSISSWDGSTLVINPTVVTQGYVPVGYSTTVGSYTATLSSQWFAGATGAWAALVENAELLLVGAAIPGASSDCFTTVYYPATTGTLNQSGLDATWQCAACCGMPVRIAPTYFPPSGLGLNMGQPAFDAIYDWDMPAGSIPNQGGLIVLASNWALTGKAPSPGPPPQTNHQTIYGQEFDPLAFALGAVTQPANFYAAGGIRTNPVTYFTTYATFTPADVSSTIGSPFGILGFRPSPL